VVAEFERRKPPKIQPSLNLPPRTFPSPPTMPLPPSFLAKKKRILLQLAVPISQYDDLSPKGSVDEGILELIGEINAVEGCVTTSSCAGRVSVFLEGKKSSQSEPNEEDGDGGKNELLDGEEVIDGAGARETKAGVGGKGGGGRWLFVSHDAVDIEKHTSDLAGYLGMRRRDGDVTMQGNAREVRFIHFKFEPMVSPTHVAFVVTDKLQILHILTASLQQAQTVLSAALQAGFRESGALNLTSNSESATPMVGIRSMGLALESIIGIEENGNEICTVREWQLRTLLEISNERFLENTKRIERFRSLFMELQSGGAAREIGKRKEGDVWEDAQVRRERKRAEGLKRSQEAKREASKMDVQDEGFL
jgi:tRNA wybutosine-synthesizing protein 3